MKSKEKANRAIDDYIDGYAIRMGSACGKHLDTQPSFSWRGME